jgi:hypothetical protein
MGGVRGREAASRKFEVEEVGNGMARVAVASVTVEKSGHGLDEAGTGTLGFFRRSGRQL